MIDKYISSVINSGMGGREQIKTPPMSHHPLVSRVQRTSQTEKSKNCRTLSQALTAKIEIRR